MRGKLINNEMHCIDHPQRRPCTLTMMDFVNRSGLASENLSFILFPIATNTS